MGGISDVAAEKRNLATNRLRRRVNCIVAAPKPGVGTLGGGGGIESGRKEPVRLTEAVLHDRAVRLGNSPVRGYCCFCGKKHGGHCHLDPGGRPEKWYWCDSCWKAKMKWEEECKAATKNYDAWVGYTTLMAQIEITNWQGVGLR